LFVEVVARIMIVVVVVASFFCKFMLQEVYICTCIRTTSIIFLSWFQFCSGIFLLTMFLCSGTSCTNMFLPMT
jgi:hypothetical protein